MTGETNLSILLKNMQPVLNTGLYVFCVIPSLKALDFDKILFFFKENEGYTIVLEKQQADIYRTQPDNPLRFEYTSVFAWITLHVHSSLDAVGLTAAFSNALAQNNISCNVVAGYYHDHIFVPQEMAQKAIAVLCELTASHI